MWRGSEQEVYFTGVVIAFKCKDRDKIVCITVCSCVEAGIVVTLFICFE
jgi:hypothetical protein